MLYVVLTYLIILNLASFISFLHDKQRAESGGRRYSEEQLMFMALLGGALGAKAGQVKFRHKRRAQPFATLFNFVLIVQAIMAIWVLSLFL